jgi:hypothetical protein
MLSAAKGISGFATLLRGLGIASGGLASLQAFGKGRRNGCAIARSVERGRYIAPDIAADTDVAATAHFNAPSELPVEGQGGTAGEALLGAAAVIVGGPVTAVLVALSCVG